MNPAARIDSISSRIFLRKRFMSTPTANQQRTDRVLQCKRLRIDRQAGVHEKVALLFAHRRLLGGYGCDMAKKRDRDEGGAVIPIDPGLESVTQVETRRFLERKRDDATQGAGVEFDEPNNWAVFRLEDNGKRGPFCGLYDFKPNEIRCADELGAGTFVALMVDADGDELPATKRVTLRIDGAIARMKSSATKDETMSAQDRWILAQQQSDERRRQAEEDRWRREREERDAREAQRDKERADALARTELEHETRRQEIRANADQRKAEIVAQGQHMQQLFQALLASRTPVEDPIKAEWMARIFDLATTRVQQESKPAKTPREEMRETIEMATELKELAGGDGTPETVGERLFGRAIEAAVPVIASKFGAGAQPPSHEQVPAPATVRRPPPLAGVKMPARGADMEMDLVGMLAGLNDDEYAQTRQVLISKGLVTAQQLADLDKLRAA